MSGKTFKSALQHLQKNFRKNLVIGVAAAAVAASSTAFAGVGDPQTKTDDPWYPGELSCSTFPRLFQTEADLYKRVTGRDVKSDQDKVLASWFWRTINYDHCTEASQDFWGKGFGKGGDNVVREYWSGLFAYGFGICFESHDQWNGEMTELLGPARSRSDGVDGHTTFEVFLKGGPYGDGQWALLDHDICTIVFDSTDKRMLGLSEITKDMSLLKKAGENNGFPIGGLAASDPSAYDSWKWAGESAGYAAAPPMVHLRSGETIRRYINPGLEDGKTFAYWGINLAIRGIPGPARTDTFVDQPSKLYETKTGSDKKTIARYGNAVYTYTPDFASGKYKEGVIDEGDDHVTFEWYSPYIVAATPANPKAHGASPNMLYADGATNGFILSGKMTCPVEISTDQGKTWKKTDACKDGLDLTDQVKGFQQYWIKFDAPAKQLAGTGLTMKTVCQCAATLVPHLKSGTNHITFEASGNAEIAEGPTLPQEEAHLIAGKFNSPNLTLSIATPRKEPAVELFVGSHQATGTPAPEDMRINIDYSTDDGKTWQSVVKDFSLPELGAQPGDYWSQSLCQGHVKLDNVTGPIQVRFANNKSRNFLLAEARLVYKTSNDSPVKVTYAWKDGSGETKTAEHTYTVTPGQPDTSWTVDAGSNPKTQWVEYACP